MTRRRAKGLITIVNNKIQDYYEHPLGASPQVLVAPVNQGGLGFPDFAKLNAIWSIAGLHRCLNSKNETFRNAFTIMHSSMQCFGIRSHRCYLPFAAPVVTWSKDNGPRTNNFLTWEIAREYIIDLGLSIVPAWDDGSSEEQHNSKSNHRQKFEEGLSLDLETQQLLQDLVDDLEEVEIDPKDYKMIWATDGSTDDAKPLEARRTGFAVVGPINFSAKLGDRLATIQDAEVTAIAVAMTLDSLIRERFELPADLKSVIYSDHLNTIRRLADSKTLEGIVVQPHLPSRHALRWLQEAAIANPDMEMVHQKSHTDERSEAARLNAAADKAAKEARDSNITLRIPAYHADLYCLYHPETGVSHAHVPTFLRHVWEKQHRNEIEVSGDVLRYQEKRLFTTAISASSAKTAMLTRSNTLGTPVRMRHSGREPRIPHCALCAADSRQIDEHHIFVSCSGVQRMRERQYNEVAKAIDAHAEKSDDWTAEDTATHVELADSLFFDCDMWGSGRTNFWKGALPKHFAYKEGHDALYNKIAGICTRTAAMIWNKHLAAEY